MSEKPAYEVRMPKAIYDGIPRGQRAGHLRLAERVIGALERDGCPPGIAAILFSRGRWIEDGGDMVFRGPLLPTELAKPD